MLLLKSVALAPRGIHKESFQVYLIPLLVFLKINQTHVTVLIALFDYGKRAYRDLC